MFVHYRTRGLILKKEDRGWADQLFTIYTQDFGRLEILGKAIRKISSKLRQGADLFYLSEIEFIQGKVYKTLTDTILIEKFDNLRKDLKRLKIAHKISEILDNLVKCPEPDENIWRLLNETFNRLNNWQIKNLLKIENWKLKIIYYYFLWNLISALGYQPELHHCSVCQKRLVPRQLYFNQKENGVICRECFKKLGFGQEISSETIKILRIIVKNDWQTLTRLKIEPRYSKELQLLSEKSYLYLCGNLSSF